MICGDQPRVSLVHLPTPLEEAPRLSDALGIDLLVKREDMAGLCVGGNKSRLLEFALGSLRDTGADTLIACAAAQSNKLRDIAAAAARAGLKAVLLVPRAAVSASGPPQGNRLLFDILGAEVREIDAGLDGAGVLAAEEAVRDELAARGHHPAILDRQLDYGIDATIAYVNAAEELREQLEGLGKAAHSVFVASGAGMTTAGLALGLKALRSPARVTGVCISTPAAKLARDIEHHADRAASRLGLDTSLAAADLTLIDDHVASGYGVVTPPLAEIVQRFARLHGMVLDPVYNAKVALALAESAASGRIPKGATVVYVNTGGGPATFEYNAELAGAGTEAAEAAA